MGLRYVMLIALGVGISARPALGQDIFFTRDFLFTRQFKLGVDTIPDPSGTPMALYPRGIYVAATFLMGGLDFQAFPYQASLRRYDLSSNELWTRKLPEIPSAMAVDATAVYVTGYVGFGRSELVVRKYDEAGNELWFRRLVISDDGYHLAAGMATDSSGVYVAAWDGRTLGLVRKYSAAGDELWSRPITVRSLRGVAIDATGVYVAGANDSGGFVNKYAAGGDPLWTRQLGSAETEIVLPGALAADSTGVYAGGSIFRRAGAGGTFLPETAETFLRKLDASGNEVWTRRFGPSAGTGVGGVAVDASGVYLTGATQSALPGQCRAGFQDVFVRKYDNAGNEQWTRQFGTSGSDFVGNVAVDSTGVYISGGIRGGSAHGSVFVAKLAKTQVAPSDSRPQISHECVVNAASYAGGGVAPGEIVTIFGRAMGPPELTPLRLAEDGRLATTLADTRIFFNGVPAPLLYVSATQSGAIVPYAVAEKPTVEVIVEYRGVRSDPLTLPVAPASPGVFTLDRSGSGQGAILNQDGSLNSPANPAERGSIIVMYVTGEGLLTPNSADGAILGATLPKPRLPVWVAFVDPKTGDGDMAEVLYAGGVFGSVAGLLQINVRVPVWADFGSAVPFSMGIGGGSTEWGVTVALR